jgi:hypothetical protein
MKTAEDILAIPTELKAQLQQALDCLAKGIRDPEAAKKASERMDRMREENRRLFGEQNKAVEIIREIRETRTISF